MFNKKKTTPDAIKRNLESQLTDSFKQPKRRRSAPDTVDDTVTELSALMYIPPQYDREISEDKPTVYAHFQGLKLKRQATDTDTRTGTTVVKRLNPTWVKWFFDGVYVQLIMMKPNTWWPVVIGSHRKEATTAPESLLVKEIFMKYPQHDLDHCLTKGMASCLFYCGERDVAQTLSRLGRQFVHLTKHVAIQYLRTKMKEMLPCIGDVLILTGKAKPKKKGDKTGISIQQLIDDKTRFPTLVIPYGKDGSNNHAIVIVDDLIFDSTQLYPLKLCRESLDWICGVEGMAYIDVAIRFNRSSQKKLSFGHQYTTNW